MAARTEHSVAASFKDAAIAAVIALALFGPLVGLRTEVTTGGLFLSQRWGDVAVAVAVVFVGRLLLNLFVFKTDRPATGWFSGLALPASGRQSQNDQPKFKASSA